MKSLLLGIIAILILGLIGFLLSLAKDTDELPTEPITNQEQQMQQPAEFQTEDLVIGEGKEATTGSLLTVHYTGTLLNGTKFDSSLDRGEPFQFALGQGNVIQGWEQGFEGMKVGGKRKLVIPAELAYGAVPGHRLQNETLVFEVELLDVE